MMQKLSNLYLRMSVLAMVWVVPVVVFGNQHVITTTEQGNIVGVAQTIQDIVGLLIPAAFGASLIAFFWGIAVYLLSAGDEDSKARGKRIMIGGAIAMVLVIGLGAVVQFILNFFGATGGTAVTNPFSSFTL